MVSFVSRKVGAVALLALIPFLMIGCGNSVEDGRLQGTWRLKKIDGSGFAPKTIRMRNGKFEVSLTDGTIGCPATYRVDGKRLKVDSNTERTCRMASLDLEIESISENEMVLRDGSVRFIYERSFE